MNKILIIFILGATFVSNSFAQLKVLNGNVGIGNLSPTYRIDVRGTARFDDWTDVYLDWKVPNVGAPQIYPERDWYLFIGNSGKKIGHIFAYDIDYTNLYKPSDTRLKENIQPIGSALFKIKQVKGVKYRLKSETYKNVPDSIKKKFNKDCFGFIAQDLDKIFPELVQKNDTGLMSVDYVSMIPIIVEALKEQDSIISLQNIQINELKRLILKNGNFKSAEISNDLHSTNSTIASLDQNFPNPFNQSTKISYYVTETTATANLYIYNMNGLQIKSIPIQKKGRGNITINGSELNPGMYIYTLIADGKEIDTKRMILTE